ncbi:hypothetical protein [Paenibacillus sp. Soil750]|uniref:hypothetical protein n=1 Tax=Paenibacillus sp. Soil750 TaxID=1736398 RepID=UPI00138F43AB|nr:hypothetical protein [Paenibacillus sp. Soil750]
MVPPLAARLHLTFTTVHITFLTAATTLAKRLSSLELLPKRSTTTRLNSRPRMQVRPMAQRSSLNTTTTSLPAGLWFSVAKHW